LGLNHNPAISDSFVDERCRANALRQQWNLN